MSGFANSKSNANEDWLISPSIDLTGKTDVKITFDHTINKGALANLQTNHTYGCRPMMEQVGSKCPSRPILTVPTGLS